MKNEILIKTLQDNIRFDGNSTSRIYPAGQNGQSPRPSVEKEASVVAGRYGPHTESRIIVCVARHVMSLFVTLDLELPWKPLHDLVEIVLYNKFESHGLILIPKNLENILKNAVRTCRPYFPVSATRQMLDEFRPLLCPFDVSITVRLSSVVEGRVCRICG